MGRIAAHNALGRGRRARFDPAAIPQVTFTDPEIAQVGLGTAQAAGRGIRVAQLALSEVDRARISGVTTGFVRIVAGRRRLLGHLGGGAGTRRHDCGSPCG
ncbi:hypothetical protein RIF23_16310 [Lipingzhangella sp. LS1_29]|uniref:Pyridine nucleotide-disulphide oxidoreductase dimerisation domain-containing protein n=1 Tax=Lipingzhangella rawalii TaxID=2055835 RepID=A0ABU2H985_9ACTN|nr:hypothetical protein [Lipingzhangella rawalii]MDS1271858.1 hypothetical protein [Lipingzhangella rawalii]